MSAPLLSLRGIHKRFGAVEALRGVDLDLRAGKVTALVGDNGAGKSTVIKTIAGSITPDAGTIEFDGANVTIGNPKRAARLGVATVYQDLALSDNLDVVANVYLGHEHVRPAHRVLGWLDEVEMERATIALLDRLDVQLPDVRALVAGLSGGQRQSGAIARATFGLPRVVLLDEPTAALSVSQTDQVLQLILRLRDQGLAVMVVSHNLADVFRVADRIAVLRLGALAADLDASHADRQQVVGLMTGALDRSEVHT